MLGLKLNHVSKRGYCRYHWVYWTGTLYDFIQQIDDWVSVYFINLFPTFSRQLWQGIRIKVPSVTARWNVSLYILKSSVKSRSWISFLPFNFWRSCTRRHHKDTLKMSYITVSTIIPSAPHFRQTKRGIFQACWALDNQGISARADYLSKQTQCKLTGADSLAPNCVQNMGITVVRAVRSQCMGSINGSKIQFQAYDHIL